ncbi:MAG: isoprenylcysteine carboxylmethyltransferase family protein [Candidatus Neomarinimicrobiota bacterium]
MHRNKIIEITTYIVVATAIWVVSPALGKYIDTFYFPYPKLLADSPATLLAGFGVILIGVILAVRTIVLFKTEGGGTPNPKLPPRNFVVSGPYRISRNPMAVGGFFTLVGESIVYYSPSLAGISLLFAIILYFNTRFIEEPELRRRFGAPYEEYLRRVPRFFPNPWKWYNN